MKNMIKLIAFCFALTLVAAPLAVHAQDKAPDKTGKTGKTEKTAKPKGSQKVDINTATAGQLAAIPGVDADTAAKIIAGRPYENKAQLKNKNIIATDLYAKIADQIVARQPKKDGDSPKKDGKAKDKSKDKAAQ